MSKAASRMTTMRRAGSFGHGTARVEPLERKLAGPRLPRAPAQLGELRDAGFAAETAVPRGAHAAEGHLWLIMNRGTVDVAHAGTDLACDTQASDRIPREHGGRQTVLCVISNADRIRLVVGDDDTHHRTEAFVAIDIHLRGHSAAHRSRHHDIVRLAATQNPGSLRNRILDQSVDMLDGAPINNSTQRRLPLTR